MASHTFNRFQAYEKEVKSLYAEFTVVASGAPVLGRALGTSSIENVASGIYRVHLAGQYPTLLYADAITSGTAVSPCHFQLKADNVSASGSFDFYTVSGTSAIQPASGTHFVLNMHLKNTTVR